MTLASHWVDDVPAQPELLELTLDEDVDLSLFPAVDGTLTDPLGEEVVLTGATFALDDEERTITISWGTPSRFEVPGVYRLQLTLVGFGAIRQRLDPELLVVEEATGWHTLSSARDEWADASLDDVPLFVLLEAAKDAVLDFAPDIADAPVPTRYRQGQLMQTRAVWNATKAGSEDSIGPDGFSVRVYPLDRNIRQLLRPKRGVPVMF